MRFLLDSTIHGRRMYFSFSLLFLSRLLFLFRYCSAHLSRCVCAMYVCEEKRGQKYAHDQTARPDRRECGLEKGHERKGMMGFLVVEGGHDLSEWHKWHTYRSQFVLLYKGGLRLEPLHSSLFSSLSLPSLFLSLPIHIHPFSVDHWPHPACQRDLLLSFSLFLTTVPLYHPLAIEPLFSSQLTICHTIPYHTIHTDLFFSIVPFFPVHKPPRL